MVLYSLEIFGKELERIIGEINADKKSSQTIRIPLSKMMVLVV